MGAVAGRLKPQGPFAMAVAMATRQRVDALKAAGLQYPQPINVLALIDTGASCSAIDEACVASLGLQPTGFVPIHSPTTGDIHEFRAQYDITFLISDQDGGPPLHATLAVVGSEFRSQGFDALIGWDVLSRCILTCDGPGGVFSLAWT